MNSTMGRNAVFALLFASGGVLADIPDASLACQSAVPETTPSTAFSVVDEGIVRHETTGLEWRRCPEGMSWVANSQWCDGVASEDLTWGEALQVAADADGWRVPNIKELRSIIERCRVDPAINDMVFPDTPRLFFWSSSPDVLFADGSLGVDFFVDPSLSTGLRLVRDASN